MYELPFQRKVERQARPKAIFSRLNPGHGLGITASTSMHMPAIKKLSHGGMSYDDGGQIDLGGGMMDSLNSPLDSLAPYINTGQSHLQGNGYGEGTSDPESQGGFAGWLNNKHAGIPGSNWLQAGLTALTGILSGVMAKKGDQKQINNNAQYAPTFGHIGFSQGGIMGCGGMSTGGRYMGDGNVMAGGGILSGPGDGTSDSIVANGGNVRVSDGEYVLSAADVANIGNGSSKAGAQKLDQARMQLRKMKTGTSRLPSKVHDGANPLLKALR